MSGPDCMECDAMSEQCDDMANQIEQLKAEKDELLAFAKWVMGQLCGDSGTGESHWEQFKEFRDGQSAIAKAEGKQ